MESEVGSRESGGEGRGDEGEVMRRRKKTEMKLRGGLL